jgi:serine phosphatase RsbU (regulator of sigma subunit)
VLFEVKPDKQPVALYDKMQPFTSISITIQKGDCIYLFTDGFADQFGGDLGKKMKSSHFKKLILEMQHLDMDSQKVYLDNQFENWRKQTNSKGEIIIHDQLDDVCVIGVKIN